MPALSAFKTDNRSLTVNGPAPPELCRSSSFLGQEAASPAGHILLGLLHTAGSLLGTKERAALFLVPIGAFDGVMEVSPLEAPGADQSRVSGPALDSGDPVSDKNALLERLLDLLQVLLSPRISLAKRTTSGQHEEGFGRHMAVGFDRVGPWMLDKTGNASPS